MKRHMVWMLVVAAAWSGALAAADDTKSAPDAKPTIEVKPADAAEPAPEPAKYLLRYKFQPGETLRWEVEHRAQIRTTVSGNTQTAETNTHSVKAWKVAEINSQDNARFVYSVERIDMRQKLTGRQEERYDSTTDKESPPGFQDVAKSVGVPLTTFTMDPTGKVVDRQEHLERGATQAAHPTLPLPAEGVPIGHKWSYTYEQLATTKDRSVKKVPLRQQMTLEDVKNGVATITIETHILAPVRQDPTIEAQLVQSESAGKVRFDIDAGRILSLQTDLDKHVVAFQGETSSLHCVTRFAEKLLPAEAKTAAKATTKAAVKTTPATKPAAPTPVAGPVAPAVKTKPTAPAGPAAPSSRRPSTGARPSQPRK